MCVSHREKIVSMEFMRKYIHVAKMIKPILTQESANYIAEEYSRLRSQNQMSSDIARVSSLYSCQEQGNLSPHGSFPPQITEWKRLGKVIWMRPFWGCKTG